MKKCYQMFGDGRLALLMIHRQFETNVAKIVGTKSVGTRNVGTERLPKGCREVVVTAAENRRDMSELT